MKLIAVIPVDLECSPLGTKSRFAADVAGQTILTRTVRQVARAEQVDDLFVVCPVEQESRCRELLGDAPGAVRGHSAGPPPYHRLVRTARKWALDGWRGGIGGASLIDEYTHTAVVAALAAQESADAVVVIPGPAPLIDPALIDACVDHFCTVSEDTRLTFAQTPPGLSPFIFQTALLAELAEKQVPPGWTLTYKPDHPESDPAFRRCCYQASQVLRHAAGRLVADTDRAVETITDYLNEHEYVGAEHVAGWLMKREAQSVPRLPREVEIELTTEHFPAENSQVALRPRVALDRRRGPIDPALVRSLADELAAYDDALVVLGGFGEPTLHPHFSEILATLRGTGVYGVAVRTNGLTLDDAIIQALIEHRVDVVTVCLDAWTPELYQKLHGCDLQTVLDGIDRLSSARGEHRQVEPLVVPEMIKSVHTVEELDPFFDGWLRKSGWACVVGYSTYADALPDHRVVDMSPPTRSPCRRIRTRCTVLADGSVIACDQDFAAARPVGSLADRSLSEVWTGSNLATLRAHHDAGRYDADPLCAHCAEWHRP
jgi:spiro-SPASM protein